MFEHCQAVTAPPSGDSVVPLSSGYAHPAPWRDNAAPSLCILELSLSGRRTCARHTSSRESFFMIKRDHEEMIEHCEATLTLPSGNYVVQSPSGYAHSPP